MKTPDEIKKELERCTTYIYGFPCEGCLYGIDAEKVESDCVDALLKDALAYIQQLEAAQQKWISVDERLPEQCVPVLVYKNSNSEAYGNMETAYFEKGRWRGSCGEFITHWMPLPKSPEMKGGEQE